MRKTGPDPFGTSSGVHGMARAVAYAGSFRFPISPWARAAEPGFVAQTRLGVLSPAAAGRGLPQLPIVDER
jgi:hypothetical protein